MPGRGTRNAHEKSGRQPHGRASARALHLAGRRGHRARQAGSGRPSGYALNRQRLETLGQVVKILKRAERQLDADQVLSVVGRYTDALALLDDYDHRRIAKPAGRKGRSRLTYGECRRSPGCTGSTPTS